MVPTLNSVDIFQYKYPFLRVFSKRFGAGTKLMLIHALNLCAHIPGTQFMRIHLANLLEEPQRFFFFIFYDSASGNILRHLCTILKLW